VAKKEKEKEKNHNSSFSGRKRPNKNKILNDSQKRVHLSDIPLTPTRCGLINITLTTNENKTIKGIISPLRLVKQKFTNNDNYNEVRRLQACSTHFSIFHKQQQKRTNCARAHIDILITLIKQ